jgi:hypothetical protein
VLFIYFYLESNFTIELMFFTWKTLKLNKMNLKDSIFCFKPISLLWVKKVSYLIAKGRYKYLNDQLFFSKGKYFTKGKNIKLAKLFIIETAFVFMLKPLFAKYISMGNFDLNEYL